MIYSALHEIDLYFSLGADAMIPKTKKMKKITTLVTAGLFTILSASAFACPKGTTLVGGTGPNHKGGSCVAANGAAQKEKTETT